MNEAFLNHPKVKEAHQLMVEADREIRAAIRKEIDANKCECKNRRNDHTESHNINYTGGVCRKCDCLNFL
jgi:hypothetical protein